jgi:single-stranded-DNA-specific exonuclease
MGRGSVTTAANIRQREVPAAVYDALPGDLDPVLRRIYAARKLAPAEVNPSLSGMAPVGTLGGVGAAAALLADVRRREGRIVVVGDYDADGATASALMVTALRGMGFERVGFLVPSRFTYGYGLSPAVAELAAAGKPDLLVTVDNGVASVTGVARARELGMKVLVTDHHLPGPELPAADVIVNPNLVGEAFASKALCGVGVAFYVTAALARELDQRGVLPYERSRPVVAGTLDLVALGTVADVVRLDHNNRILVGEGLRRIRAGLGRPGLNALFEVVGRDPAAASAGDLGFVVAPRLNAAGRLADMTVGIECLLAADRRSARLLAARLHELNAERRDLQARMQTQAEQQLGRLAGELAGVDGQVGCLFDPGWHEGIVGLVASRLRERTDRPAVAFAPAEEEGIIKGSARSVEGVHIRDVLAAIAARGVVPEMTFGGHAMAAGLRLPLRRLEEFRAAFTEEVQRQLAGMESARVIWTDGPLDAGQARVELAERLHTAGPWGQGFPEPLFDNELAVLDQRVLKDAHLRLALRHPRGGEPVEAIAFNETRPLPDAARFVYRLGINDFGGRRRCQLVVEHIECE